MRNKLLIKSIVLVLIVLLLGTSLAVGFIPRINIKTYDKEQNTTPILINNNIISPE